MVSPSRSVVARSELTPCVGLDRRGADCCDLKCRSEGLSVLGRRAHDRQPLSTPNSPLGESHPVTVGPLASSHVSAKTENLPCLCLRRSQDWAHSRFMNRLDHIRTHDSLDI